MKSIFSRFKKLQKKSVSEITNNLGISDEKLYQLLQMWISQGLLSPELPLYTQLHETLKRRHMPPGLKRREKDLKKYLDYRRNGYNSVEIARNMHYSKEKVFSFLRHYYNTMRRDGLSDENIAQKLNIPMRELKPAIRMYDEREREKADAKRQRLLENRKYAHHHLRHIWRDMNGSSEYYIFDIEAVQCPDELIEISVIDCKGNIVYDTLVHPSHKIGWRIRSLTGITDEMVQNKPSIDLVMSDLKRLFDGKILMSWGIDYDSILLQKSSAITGISLNCKFCCAQKIHMGVHNALNQVSLYKASGDSDQSHRALADCQMVLKVLKNDLKQLEAAEHHDQATVSQLISVYNYI